MAAEDDWKGLPLEERLVHKVWKARFGAYEELAVVFKDAEGPSDKSVAGYSGKLKKFVMETNVMAQLKGIIAATAYVEFVGSINDVANGLVEAVVLKCLNSSKQTTKDAAGDLVLMLVETVKSNESLIEGLVAGYKNKQPKIVTASVALTTKCISLFGVPVIQPKPILKALEPLFAHADTNVRNAAKDLAHELYCWIGAPVERSLKNIKPVQMTELQKGWESVTPGSIAPERLTRDAQAKQQKKKSSATNVDGADDHDNNDNDDADERADSPAAGGMDEYDISDPVVVKIPANFDKQIVEKKWSDRKEALEELFKAIDHPKLESFDNTGSLVTTLCQVVDKDTNVLNVSWAAKCLGALAHGLRNHFSSYTVNTMKSLLNKFKEKKANVVTALVDASDKVIKTNTLDKLCDTFVAALKSKNPSVKQETCSVLARYIPSAADHLTKIFIKTVAPLLVEKLSDSVEPIRTAAAMALAAMLSVAGERSLRIHLDKADEAKAKKVRELSANVGVNTSAPTSSKSTSSSATATKKATAPNPSRSRARPTDTGKSTTSRSKALAKSTTRKSSTSASASSGRGGGGGGGTEVSYGTKPAEITFANVGLEEAATVAEKVIEASKQEQLADPNWKERLAAATELASVVESASLEPNEALSLFKVLEARSKKWKDTNFQVVSKLFNVMSAVAKIVGVALPDRCVAVAMPGLIAKIGDVKIGPHAVDCLMSFCEATSVSEVTLQVMELATANRSPKVKEESLKFLSSVVDQFGLKFSPNAHATFVKSCLGEANPAVRQAALTYAEQLFIAAGPKIKSLFSKEKQSIIDQIEDRFSKAKGKTLPSPSRFQLTDVSSSNATDVTEDGADTVASSKSSEPEVEIDMGPRTDLLASLPRGCLEKLPDKAWKIRQEGLLEIRDAVDKAEALSPMIGDLASALAGRLVDSNKNLVIITLNILTTIAENTGAPIKKNVSQWVDGALHNLADAKDTVRAASLSLLDAWHDQIGLGFFTENEKVALALKSCKPNQQISLLHWLKTHLDDVDPGSVGLKQLVKPLICCLEDRNKDVRQGGHTVFEIVVASVGSSKIKSLASNLSGSTKTMVLEIIANAPKGNTTTAVSEEPRSSRTKPSSSSSTKTSTSTSTSRSSRPSTTSSRTSKTAKATTNKRSSSTEEPGETSLVLDPNGKAKRQKDEKNSKTLKWAFTAPREEFVQQLSDQAKSCTSSELLKMLFHKDFKMHVKALDCMIDAVQAEDREPLFNASDVLLRWITLRFFEPNPTVLMKCMTFCQELFDAMGAEGLALSDYEGGGFLPYLTQQSGSKLEQIRVATHTLLRSICKTYPSSKVFQYLLEGLTSKNAKQRSELLQELSYMIHRQGMSVCQMGVGKSMKLIAKQVSDRDTNVRTAALDCIVTVWNILGDDVYKLMGDLGDKNTSLVEERIKRHGQKSLDDASAPSKSKTARSNSTRSSASTSNNNAPKTRPSTAPGRSPARQPDPSVPQHFALNLGGLDMPHLDVGSLNLRSTDVNFDDDVPVDISRTPPRLSTPTGIPSASSQLSKSPPPPMPVFETVPNEVDAVIEGLISNDPLTAIHALKNAEALSRSDSSFLPTHANEILDACTSQARMLFQFHLASDNASLADGVRLCKHLLGFVLNSFRNDAVVAVLQPPVVTKMIADLLRHVQSKRLGEFDEGVQITQALNCILLKILQSVEQNQAFSMLIDIMSQFLHLKDNVKHIQLVQRCIWKLVKSLPEHTDSIDASALFAKIHEFLGKHPTQSNEATNEDSIPTKTMRKIIQELVKAKGSSVTESVDCLGPSPYKTTCGVMILQALAKIHIFIVDDQQNTGPVKFAPEGQQGAMASTRLTVDEQDDRMVEVFAMITSKEETKAGMNALFDFMNDYPSADVEKFLQTTSPFFQNHIKRSLADIKRNREATKRLKAKMGAMGGSKVATTAKPKSAAVYLDKLRLLTNNKENATSSTTDPLKFQDEAARSTSPDLPELEIDHSDTHVRSPSKIQVNQLDALKARLAKFHKK